jgi:hypothetical protein
VKSLFVFSQIYTDIYIFFLFIYRKILSDRLFLLLSDYILVRILFQLNANLFFFSLLCLLYIVPVNQIEIDFLLLDE